MSVCQSCGACCASFLITLPRIELDSVAGGWVPATLTESYTPSTACMRDNPEHPGRCIALAGTVGDAVHCTIYANRPSACREFAPLSLIGQGDESCNDARRRHGLRALGTL